MAPTVGAFAATSPFASATIRNTFLEFREDAPSGFRRSKSAPPSALKVVPDDKADCGFMLMQDACSTPSIMSDADADDVSTEDSVSEAAFEHASSTSSGSLGSDEVEDCIIALNSEENSTCNGPLRRRRWASVCDEDSSDVLTTLFQESPPPMVPALPSVPCVPATLLNPRARAWAPIVSPEIQPPRYNFQENVVSFVDGLAAELQRLPCCKGARVEWQHMPGGVASCTLVALVSSDDESAEQMTTAAKKTVHSASLVEKGVELIGCKAEPFSPTPQGFVAVLGNPQIKRKRCAKFYEQGVCPYGNTCGRLHPTCTVSLNLVMEVSNM